jgi:CubicO group peptidase (beta-lactamase class C family)
MLMNGSRRAFLRQFVQAHLLALGGCSPRTTTDTRGSLEQWTKRFTDLEQQAVDSAARHSVPGVSLAVVKDARLVWSRGLGIRDQASRGLLSEDSVFEAASMSKPVFAYAVMKLHERGVLDLDRPLTTYTAECFLNGDPRLDLITARHVLSHTSGFPDIRSRENPLKIHFKPGETWQYSGEGYAYLQSVATRLTGHVLASPCGTYEADLKVCGTDFDSYMQTNVLRPLGMRSSGYLWHDGLDQYLARPHDAQGRPLGARKYTSADAARYGSMGGLLTTATDYANFLIAIMDPKPADVFRLRKASIDEMLTPQVKVEDGPGYSISWALGWKVAKTVEYGVLVSHGGDQSGFHSVAEMSPSRKSGYVILTNGENGWKLIQELASGFARRVHSLR